MFESSLLSSAGNFAPRRRGATLAAVAVQLTAATVVLLLPLIHPELLPRSLPAVSLAPPRLPPPTPPPAARPHVTASAAQTAAPSAPAAPQPTLVSRTSTLTTREPSDAPPAIGTTLNLGSGSFAVGPPATLAAGIGSGTGPKIGVTPSAPAKPASLLKISGGVSAGLLLAPIQPVYPTLAKATHTEGTVVIQAVISRTGTVERAHAISGPLMLQGAALEAVTHARYHPYLLNGDPTEVETTFTINFRMQ